MEDSILKREQHYLELNEELEMKSKETWQQIENVLKGQVISSRTDISNNYSFLSQNICKSQDDFEITRNSYDSISEKLNRPPSRTEVHETSHHLRSYAQDGKRASDLEVIDDFIPLEAKHLSSQSKVRFLTAKTRVLYEECLSLRNTLKKQREETLQLRKCMQKADDERQQWQQSSKQFEETAKKNAIFLEEANRRCLKKDAENTAIRKEMEKMSKELKVFLQKHGNNEVRLNRIMEENEKLKSALKAAKLEEKEKVSENKKRQEELVANIQKLEKQKCELIVVFKKQLQLIDNLKRQRILTEVNSNLGETEDNFLQLLEWNPEETN